MWVLRVGVAVACMLHLAVALACNGTLTLTETALEAQRENVNFAEALRLLRATPAGQALWAFLSEEGTGITVDVEAANAADIQKRAKDPAATYLVQGYESDPLYTSITVRAYDEGGAENLARDLYCLLRSAASSAVRELCDKIYSACQDMCAQTAAAAGVPADACLQVCSASRDICMTALGAYSWPSSAEFGQQLAAEASRRLYLGVEKIVRAGVPLARNAVGAEAKVRPGDKVTLKLWGGPVGLKWDMWQAVAKGTSSFAGLVQLDIDVSGTEPKWGCGATEPRNGAPLDLSGEARVEIEIPQGVEEPELFFQAVGCNDYLAPRSDPDATPIRVSGVVRLVLDS